MIVLTFYLMRLDQFKRDDESVEEHMNRMTKSFEDQEERVKAHGMDSIKERRVDFPDWLVALIKTLPGDLKPTLWARIKNWFRKIFGGHGPLPTDLVKWCPDNKEYKVFFSGKGEAVAACGWRTRDEADTPGHFQREFERMIASDPEKAKWASSNRLQIGGLTEINNDALAMDEDLLDVHRSTY